ncbi:MAG: hypothetical protein AUH42_02805 [Gemmatimonadetes bacterium 13_1_40CM_70_11]|nr:MAG: hypothetical protein AUH42_02805 [Gemmatimonadetes bacterium 13_1_40CM_70_11]
MRVNLRDPLAVVRRHLWLVLGMTAVVGGIVGYRAYAAVPSYRAIAVIRLSDPRRALTGGVADGPTGDLAGSSADPLLSQVELLTSRRVGGVVVDSMLMLRVRARNFPTSILAVVQLPSDVGGDSLRLEFNRDSLTVLGRSRAIRTSYGTSVELDGMRFTVVARPTVERGTISVVSREEAINGLLGGLRVTLRPHTDIFDVAYVASDPQHAQQVVNRVVEVFRAVNAEEAQRQSRLRREFLETQLRVNDSVLADARRALTAFRRHAGRAGSDQQGPTQQAGIDQLQLQRDQLDADRRMYRSILVSLDSGGGRGNREALRTAASTPAISANAVVAPLFTQLVQYENTRDSLTARSTTHPDVPRLNQLLVATEGKLLRAVQSALKGLIASLDVRIATLDDLRVRRVANVEQRSSTDAEEARLEERVENGRKIADELRIEYQRARIAEAVEVGHVEIVDLAVPPTAPLGIGFAERLALGLLFGLVLGGGSAWLTEHLRSSIARPNEIVELGLPLLGAVPRCQDGRNGSSVKAVGAVIEAFRGLRLNLAYAYGAAGPVLLVLSSPRSREGKSFIAANLALAFAQANYRTLLIDGDTRRGALHKVLAVARKPGLTDFLGGDVSWGEIIQVTRHGTLHFIGCGMRRPDSPELLSSPRMSDLFAQLRANFAVIIVDSPPLGAGVDAFALATITGHLVMVLRPGTTNREVIEAKLDLLHRLPVRVLGAVLNDVQDGPEYTGYSYYLEGYEATAEGVREHHTVLRSSG